MALLGHQFQMGVAGGHVETLGGGNFQEADDHRQRRAQLVRRVGDEVAPHLFDALGFGGVVRDQDLAPVLERNDVHDQLALAEADRQRLLVATEDDVIHEVRVTHQVGHAHALVALVREAQVLFGSRVAPLEEQHVVHDHHAVGQQVHGLAEARQPLGQLGLVFFVVAAHAVQAREDIGPGAPAIGQLGALRVVHPVAELVKVGQLHEHHHHRRQQGDHDAGHPAEHPAQQRAARRDERSAQGGGYPEQQFWIHETRFSPTTYNQRCARS